MLLLDTNLLIDVLRGESVALAWLEQQQQPRISVITWIEVLVGCRNGETERVGSWLDQVHARRARSLGEAEATAGEPVRWSTESVAADGRSAGHRPQS